MGCRIGCIVGACKIFEVYDQQVTVGISQWLDDLHEVLGRMVLPPTDLVTSETLTSGVLLLNGSMAVRVCWSGWYHCRRIGLPARHMRSCWTYFQRCRYISLLRRPYPPLPRTPRTGRRSISGLRKARAVSPRTADWSPRRMGTRRAWWWCYH